MYEGGRGAGAVGSGAVILPNTGGNTVLNVIAITLIAVGVVILVTTVARMIAVRAHKA